MENRRAHRQHEPRKPQRGGVAGLLPDGEKKRRQPEQVLQRARAGDDKWCGEHERPGKLMQDVSQVRRLGVRRTPADQRADARVVGVVIIASEGGCVHVYDRIHHREDDHDDGHGDAGESESDAAGARDGKMWRGGDCGRGERGIRSGAGCAAVFVDDEERGADEGEPDCSGRDRVQSSGPVKPSGT